LKKIERFHPFSPLRVTGLLHQQCNRGRLAEEVAEKQEKMNYEQQIR